MRHKVLYLKIRIKYRSKTKLKQKIKIQKERIQYNGIFEIEIMILELLST